LIEAAVRIADQAYERLAERGVDGRTERAIAADLEAHMRELGAEDRSFAALVASGAHGALPHASPRDVPIERDTLMVVDMGCVVDGYCSDATRTFATGALSDEMEAVYALVLGAQESALAAIKAGVEGRQADAAAREIIADAGFGEHFGHPLGHGVGLDVHEGPRLAASTEQQLVPGNVVTVEPGVYLPGRFGVRIEDLVVVTEDGAEILTSFSKALIKLP
jgi:Xaa-Pro aminopeptidase